MARPAGAAGFQSLPVAQLATIPVVHRRLLRPAASGQAQVGKQHQDQFSGNSAVIISSCQAAELGDHCREFNQGVQTLQALVLRGTEFTCAGTDQIPFHFRLIGGSSRWASPVIDRRRARRCDTVRRRTVRCGRIPPWRHRSGRVPRNPSGKRLAARWAGAGPARGRRRCALHDADVIHRLRIANSRLLLHVDPLVRDRLRQRHVRMIDDLCRCKPAGTPKGTCGGPARPIGVPQIGMPYCGAVMPAT